MNLLNHRASGIIDWFGIMASSACAVHCAVVPMLLVSGTILPSSIFGGEYFHTLMVWLIIPAAVLAFTMGCWRHKDAWVLGLGLTGLTGLVLSIAIPHETLGETGERVLTLLSAGLLITAHYRNYRLCRSYVCHQC